ncbi:MAG TPA: ribosomal protein S18-alanine N-acetyltransferase [Longimicrobiaceae bacterium]
MDDRCRVRPAWPADAPVLAALERRCFKDPWSIQSFREALELPHSFGLVAECGGEIAGYLIGRALVGTGEILNLAVLPEWRRRRIARQLLDAGLAELTSRGAEEVFLEVRESNLAAQALYVGAGFRPVGQRAGYYRNPREDALVLRSAIPPAGQNG